MAPTAKPPAFDWGKLPDAKPMAETTGPGGIKVDVITNVPEAIRLRAEVSLAINTARVAAKAGSTASRSRVPYHWDCQPVPTQPVGDDFVKLMTKYAKFRPAEGAIPFEGDTVAKGQATARCGTPGYFRVPEDGEPVACEPTADGAFLGVRFSVRPFEKRKDTANLPGTS